VLSVAGITLLDHIGEEDLVGRIGGEEFAMLLPLTTLAEACERAETIRAAIERRRIPRDSLAIMVTSSIGLAELQPDEALDQLYARADAALYAAKAAGRNRVETMAVTG
jgi:diguanylate cyclase (GGDEF)-like protein